MRLPANKHFLAKWSVVCSRVVASRIVHSLLRANAIRKAGYAGVSVATGAAQSYSFTTDIWNALSPNASQVDIILRFTTGASGVDTAALDDQIAYAWNDTIGSPRIPAPAGTRAGALFAECSHRSTISAGGGASGFLGIDISLEPRDYSQVCSNYVEIATINDGIVESASILDSLTGSRIQASSNPALVGTNANGMRDVSDTARDLASSAARGIQNATEGALGMSSNDIKFFMYASLGIVAALVGVKVLKEVKAI